MFVTKAFSLDCPYNTYITISAIIRVISVAVNMSTSAIKLFRKDWNLELFSSGVSKLHSSLSNVFLLFLYLIAKSHNVLGALIKFGLSQMFREILAESVPGLSNLTKFVSLNLLKHHRSNS